MTPTRAYKSWWEFHSVAVIRELLPGENWGSFFMSDLASGLPDFQGDLWTETPFIADQLSSSVKQTTKYLQGSRSEFLTSLKRLQALKSGVSVAFLYSPSSSIMGSCKQYHIFSSRSFKWRDISLRSLSGWISMSADNF